MGKSDNGVRHTYQQTHYEKAAISRRPLSASLRWPTAGTAARRRYRLEFKTHDPRSCSTTTRRLSRGPYSVVPEPPTIGRRVPHELGPGRPRRSGRLRRRPWRRRPPGSPARRTALTGRALPVVAAIPVPVVDGSPARVPLLTWAPVIAGRGGRGRLCRGTGPAGQAESGQSQTTAHQHRREPPSPRSCLFFGRHLPRFAFGQNPGKWLFPGPCGRRHFAMACRTLTPRR
jgi:hypothetical protein